MEIEGRRETGDGRINKQRSEQDAVEWREYTRSRADFDESLGTDLKRGLEHDGDGDAVRWGRKARNYKGGPWHSFEGQQADVDDDQENAPWTNQDAAPTGQREPARAMGDQNHCCPRFPIMKRLVSGELEPTETRG